MNKELFYKELEKNNIVLNDIQKEQLDTYCNFLIEYNKHTNLTAIKEEKDIYLKHFYDSLTLTKVYNLKDEKILDIGTGAGFPGMVLKIVYPSIELTLLDSNNKKTKFLEELIDKLHVDKVTVINKRAEDYIKEKREYFDIVTSRAVSDLTILSELSLPFVRINGYYIPLKGSNIEEINNGKYSIKILGGNIERIENITLPIEHSERNILLIKKVDKTPSKYPRLYSQIIKNPLKNGTK